MRVPPHLLLPVFKLYHHHQLDRLSELQAALLNEARRTHALNQDIVIVPNQGVARWLQIQLAESEGIAANLDMPLPAKFIWDMLPRVLPHAGDSRAFERRRLSWHVYALLPQLTAQIPQVAAYLNGSNSDIQRLQLAEQLADVFDQYLVFRPRMLDNWLGGNIGDNPVEQWQALVWRALSDKLQAPHRGQQLHKAIRHMQSKATAELAAASLPRHIYCFGLGSLPPDYLRFLYALGQHCDVHFLLLNPCEHYWGDIQQQRISSLASQPDEPDALEQGLVDSHPLLASLGRGTRDLLRLLYSEELLQLQEPQLGRAMDYEAPAKTSLLRCVQAGVINMQLDAPLANHGVDASVQLHSCHGPLREVQVLHDQLLDLLSADDQLQTRDIIVMMPNIAAYAAAIDGVFGAAQGAKRIDYSLSDNSRAASHPVVRSFCQLLNLPLSRWGLSEVMDLAQVPAVMRRFELSPDALEQAHDWLRAAGVRWGLDGTTRQQFEAGDFSEYSWQFGLDRLLLGLSLNDDSALFNGVAAWTDLEGGSTAALGQVWLLLQRLRHWQQAFLQDCSAADWQQNLNQMLDDVLDEQGADDAEQNALQELRHSIDSLATASECLGSEPISWMTVREVLLGELSQASARQPFLSHGVTFCGMVPLRAVPFKVVCMLGMDDGAFPRQDSQGHFNLLRQNPRLGDISVRDDDRLLFLQSIMAAQQVFYISYTGQDVASGETLPPAPIVGEWLDFLHQQYFANLTAQEFEQAMIARQPMHPFSPALYGQAPSHPRVFSFEQAWLANSPPSEQPSAHFIDDGERAAPIEGIVELSQLKRFFEHPARFFLRDVMQIQRELPGQEVADEEPLVLDGLQAWQLRERLLREASDGPLAPQASPHLLASGLLPPAPLDAASYEQAYGQLQELIPLWQQWQGERGDDTWLDVDINVSGLRLRGRITDLWPDGPRLLRSGRLSMKYRLRRWIDYLCYLMVKNEGTLRMAGLNLKKQKVVCVQGQLQRDLAEQHLQQLLMIYQQGQCRPLPFDPNLADEWLTHREKSDDDEAALQKVNNALANTFIPHQLIRDPWFQPLLQKHQGVDQEFAQLANDICGPLLSHLHDQDISA